MLEKKLQTNKQIQTKIKSIYLICETYMYLYMYLPNPQYKFCNELGVA